MAWWLEYICTARVNLRTLHQIGRALYWINICNRCYAKKIVSQHIWVENSGFFFSVKLLAENMSLRYWKYVYILTIIIFRIEFLMIFRRFLVRTGNKDQVNYHLVLYFTQWLKQENTYRLLAIKTVKLSKKKLRKCLVR